jgi:hypothetical protein
MMVLPPRHAPDAHMLLNQQGLPRRTDLGIMHVIDGKARKQTIEQINGCFDTSKDIIKGRKMKVETFKAETVFKSLGRLNLWLGQHGYKNDIFSLTQPNQKNSKLSTLSFWPESPIHFLST